MCILLFLCEIWALCEFICSSQLCNTSASRHINPSSTVWAFSIQQQQSGNRAVAAGSMHSRTSCAYHTTLSNIPSSSCFLLTSVPGAVCAKTMVLCVGGDPALILRGPECPRKVGWQQDGHPTFCCPSPQPFPRSLA